MVINIRRGLDIPLLGRAEKILQHYTSSLYAVKPSEFRLFEPKLLVSEGERVQAGQPLVFHKSNESIVLSSPVSGRVQSIVRGEKRRLEAIIIQQEGNETREFGVQDFQDQTREKIIEKILQSGLWPVVRQRPFNIIADPNKEPQAIFISGFDTAPLAPDYTYVMQQHDERYFRTGIQVLQRLTTGKVNLCVHPQSGVPAVYRDLPGVLVHEVYGPHPASNVGVQIHHILPIRKGDLVWHVEPQHVIWLGRLFTEGIYFPEKIYALAGSELKKTYYFRAISGVCVADLLKDNIVQDNVRVISGNVLTGTQIEKSGFIGFYENMVTVIPEGNYYRFMGWALPPKGRFITPRSFLMKLLPKKLYRLDTNMNGEERAFVISGEYEKVFPMEIMPVQLLKAIIVKDFDAMERLGIYEVVEEDFALCEFICTSKIPSQKIIREGIDFMINELKD